MLAEEAIKLLSNTDHLHETPNGYYEALDMGIEALRNEINCVKCVHYTERETPTGIKGVCKMDTAHREDIISRQDAIRWVKTECNPYGKPTLDFESGKRVIEHLGQMPSADKPTGEWVSKESEDGVYWWHECSECGEKPLLDRWMHDEKLSDFCWNCGSKMFKGGEEE